MLSRKPKDSELLPGANPDQDCQTPQAAPPAAPPQGDADEDDQDHEHDVTWGALEERDSGDVVRLEAWQPQRSRWARGLERVALAVERPFNRITGSTQLNPFYHTGPIAVFLLALVGLTGFYLFLFYQYGFGASYRAVSTRIEGQLIARAVRAVHRYASGTLVIVTLLHAYRTLFMERFRGPRWLAWVTGFAMTVLLWLAGVTGYWLVWDQRAQLIYDRFVDFLQAATGLAPRFMAAIARAQATETSWPIFLVILGVHVLLFLIVALFFWYHVRRLQRTRWLPTGYWIIAVGIVVVVVSALFPLGMLPSADLARLPGAVTFDPLFLFYLPVESALGNWLLWGGLVTAVLALAALPWWLRGRRSAPPVVNIIKDRCTGCTKCALDCPYGAIEMVERHDDKPHRFIAIEDPALCVSCGICVGSCDGVAVTLGTTPPEMLWDTVAARLALARLRSPAGQTKIIFTCERHASQGARPYLTPNATTPDNLALEVITLACVGTLPPDLLARTLDAGVSEVQVVGCPPGDCANREGNLWAEQRLVRERVPRLKRSYANAPITAAWLPPDDFALALPRTEPPLIEFEAEDDPEESVTMPSYLEQRRMFPALTWRNLVPGVLVLAVLFAAQVLLTNWRYTPHHSPSAMTHVVLGDVGAPLSAGSYLSSRLGSQLVLRYAVDGQLVDEMPYATADLLEPGVTPFYLEHALEPGTHRLRLVLVDDETAVTFILFDSPVTLEAGEILRIE